MPYYSFHGRLIYFALMRDWVGLYMLGGAKTRWGNFAPRIGLAYSLTPGTVLRGGYGIAYERIQGNFIFSAINNAPFNSSTVVLDGVVENPTNGAASALAVRRRRRSAFAV